MTDVSILAVLAKTTLLEVAKQASALGTGLQNAAPGDKAVAPNHSIQYLLKAADDLNQFAENCDDFLPPHSQSS